MDDTIYRQDAFDALNGLTEIYLNNLPPTIYKADAVETVKALPSAQPEPEEFEWCHTCREYDQEKHCCHRWTKVIRKTVDDMKAAQPGWIPVTERLPEDAYPVIVTWKNDDPKSYYQYILGKHYTGVAHFKNGIWYWYSSTTEDVLMEYGRCDSEEFDEAIQVLAWQPLPTPYREGGQDNG